MLRPCCAYRPCASRPCVSQGHRRTGAMGFQAAGSAGGISPPVAHRTVRKPLDLHGSPLPCHLTMTDDAESDRSSRLPGWRPPSLSIRFAPRSLQALHRYYRMIRPLHAHRYFPPSCFALIGSKGPTVRNRTVRNRILSRISPSTCARRWIGHQKLNSAAIMREIMAGMWDFPCFGPARAHLSRSKRAPIAGGS
jgi:hypothetical protein